MQPLSKGIFQNRFTSSFPGDNSGNKQPRQTPGVLYSFVAPTSVKSPKLLAWSASLAEELNIAFPNNDDLNILAGNLLTPSMKPYAAAYAGHQFGHWAGQLGDGRAITLGEWQLPNSSSVEIQLKGAGITPYSRGADGRAVLRSSLREYLLSEAMHYLHVPTTRALSLVTTGEDVVRDMFYNGFPELETGAIVTRVTPSFLRFGNFELLAARKETEQLQQLADWTILHYFPDIKTDDKYIGWFNEITNRTAKLMVEWNRVGFVHGVMNTDNMSILGLTIDYGPFSFLDEYDNDFTPNTTDLPGKRYAFGKQANIAHWNLTCLANAIAPLVQDTDALISILRNFPHVYTNYYHQMMSDKLGFDNIVPEDLTFLTEWNKMLDSIHPDMTIFYHLLASIQNPNYQHFQNAFYHPLTDEQVQLLDQLLQQYEARIFQNKISRKQSLEKMSRNNPVFIPRNYLLRQAIENIEDNNNDRLFLQLQKAIETPYENTFPEFITKRPDTENNKSGSSMLSCSS